MTVEEKINELQAQIDELKIEAKRNKKTFRKHDKYYFVTINGEVNECLYRNDVIDKQLIDYNNIFDASFSEKVHLQWYAENVLKVQNRLMQLHEQLCPDYFPDWDNVHYVYDLHFDIDTHEWSYSLSRYAKYWNVCFTEEAAKKAVDILNTEKFMME